MTRWAFVVDLSRCVGCQTCTASCKHTNATGPWVQWRKVLDFEAGEYPDVSRAFVPVGCMHCEQPSCMEVCPTTATRQRDDGIVTIDYDICIGCTYCIQACPYQARFKVDRPNEVYGSGKQMGHELKREDWARRGVAQKCTMCSDRIDAGLAQGLTPGIDEEATPSCVGSCISGALQMGDLDDPSSHVSHLMAKRRSFRMHEELGNEPGFYYLYEDSNDNADEDASPAGPPEMVADPVGMGAISPQLQTHWDWRAAGNFAFGGTGTGLMAAAMMAGFFSPIMWLAVFLAVGFVGLGLFFVWLEIGRPLRFLNVYLNPQTSWMTREAYAVSPYFVLGGLAWLLDSYLLGLGAALCGAGFLYAQARVLRAAKAIPAWRQEGIVALILSTGFCEGFGLLLVLSVIAGHETLPQYAPASALALIALIAWRFLAWKSYRSALGAAGAPTQVFQVFDGMRLEIWHGVAVVLALYAAFRLPEHQVVLGLAGLSAMLAGWFLKFTLITRAALNQGYAINRMPARGAGKSSPGIQPGWTKS
ncbi:MAG: 4Fe-4S dicluster domain-containing protein [Rhodobacteraceae bacterium]|nr:4Fe-4S dicluster domain-containing protein [Paracoccaceae bacterium]